MSILDKAKAHFLDAEIQSVDVPEWDLVIYWKPWTIAERQKVWGAIKASGRDTEISARVIITKALDKDGKNLFSIGDLRTLTTEVDFAVVERISALIMGVPASPEETEKN